MRRCVLFTVLLIVCGCELLPKYKYKLEPNVVAILNIAHHEQRVFVGKSYPIFEQPSSEKWWGVSGAHVKISFDAVEVTFHELADTMGIYASGSLLVRPSETYFLEVIYPSGEVITGKTTVPELISIVQPTSGDTVRPEQELTWKESSGAAGYIIYFKVDSLVRVPGYFYFSNEQIMDVGLDTSVTFTTILNYEVYDYTPQGGERINLQIYALDTNYYSYRSDPHEHMHPGDYRYLDGGYGVFGSFIVSEPISVVVKP